MLSSQRIVALTSLLALVLVVAISAQIATGESGSKPPPGSGPIWSDAEHAANITAFRARDNAYLADFQAKGLDPRGLPLLLIPGTNVGPRTLAETIAHSSGIVRGTVTRTTFSSLAEASLPIAESTLMVREVLKGASLTRVAIRQTGGPVPQAGGGALAQLEADPLILSGDDVFVFFVDQPGYGLRPLPVTGIVRVVSGRVRANEHSAFAGQLTGMTPTAFAATVRNLSQGR